MTDDSTHDAHDPRADRRRRLAALVRQLYDNQISSGEFFRTADEMGLDGDPEAEELVLLLRHEPGGTWLFGVAGEVHRKSVARIRELVERFGAG